jgi:hypothetical protein
MGAAILAYTYVHTGGILHVAEARIEEAKKRTAEVQKDDEHEEGSPAAASASAAPQAQPAAASAKPPAPTHH